MKIEAAVKHETGHILLGVVLMSIVMELVFVCLGRFDVTVLLGNLLGGGFAVLNFFLMALNVQKSVQRETPEEAKLAIQNSYTRRLLLLTAALIIGFKLSCFNWVAVVIPLIFPRIIIFIKTRPCFQRKGEG